MVDSLDYSKEEFVATAGSIGGVLCFGPILSIAVLTAKFALLRAFSTLSTRDTEAAIQLQRAAARAKLARLGVLAAPTQEEVVKSVKPQRRRHSMLATVRRPSHRRAETTGNLALHA